MKSCSFSTGSAFPLMGSYSEGSQVILASLCPGGPIIHSFLKYFRWINILFQKGKVQCNSLAGKKAIGIKCFVSCFVSCSRTAHSRYVLLMNLRYANRNVLHLATPPQETRCLFSPEVYVSHWLFQSAIAANFWAYKHHFGFACLSIFFVTCARHYCKLLL